MIVLPENENTYKPTNRLLWWAEGFCGLFDGLFMVLSIGYFYPALAVRLAEWRLKRALRDPFNLIGDLTQDQISNLKARIAAKRLWDYEPKTTITDMCRFIDIHEAAKKPDGTYYSVRTVREWIKDLCPDRSPGRRPNR